MEASMVHGSESSSMEVDLLPWELVEVSIEVGGNFDESF